MLSERFSAAIARLCAHGPHVMREDSRGESRRPGVKRGKADVGQCLAARGEMPAHPDQRGEQAGFGIGILREEAEGEPGP